MLARVKPIGYLLIHLHTYFHTSPSPDIIPVEVQLCRATLRSYWHNLYKNIDPKQILRVLDASTPEILSEEDCEEVLEITGSERVFAGAKVVLEKLILCDKPHVYENLLKALGNPDFGVQFLADGIEGQYRKIKELLTPNSTSKSASVK